MTKHAMIWAKTFWNETEGHLGKEEPWPRNEMLVTLSPQLDSSHFQKTQMAPFESVQLSIDGSSRCQKRKQQFWCNNSCSQFINSQFYWTCSQIKWSDWQACKFRCASLSSPGVYSCTESFLSCRQGDFTTCTMETLPTVLHTHKMWLYNTRKGDTTSNT